MRKKSLLLVRFYEVCKCVLINLGDIERVYVVQGVTPKPNTVKDLAFSSNSNLNFPHNENVRSAGYGILFSIFPHTHKRDQSSSQII